MESIAKRIPVINSFTGDNHFLSNFYVRPIQYMGMEFKSGEHLFNALKTIDITEALWVINAPTPGIAKQRGRKVTLKPNWDDKVRYEAMRSTLGAKFLNDFEMSQKLLDTGDDYLIEGNTWHDNVWGTCICGRSSCATGSQNKLGEFLMELREDIRKWS